MIKYLTGSFSKGKYFLLASLTEVSALFLYNLYIARVFGPDVYGEIKTVLAVTGIIITFFDFGFPIHLQRYAAGSAPADNELSKIIFVKLVLASIYFLITFFYFFVFSSNVNWIIVIILSASTFLLSFSNIFYYLYYGKNKISLTFKFTLLSRLFLIVCLAFCLFLNLSVELVLAVLLLSNSVLVIFSITGLGKINTGILFAVPRFKEVIILLEQTAPLGLTTIFNFLYGKIDIVIISVMLNYIYVAQYNVPYGIYKLSGMIFSAFLIPAFNLFAEHQNDKAGNIKIFRSFAVIILSSSLVIGLLLFFLGGDILSFLYGNKYKLAVDIIPYFSIAVIGLGMNSLTGSFLNATGNYKATMYTTMAGFIFNVSANIILINKLGLIGAVYTAVLTEGIVFLLQLIYILKINTKIIWRRA